MAITRTDLQAVVQAENDRLHKIDVEKARVRLEEIGRLRKAQAANTKANTEANAKLQEAIEKIQKELVELQFNEVTIEDATGGVE